MNKLFSAFFWSILVVIFLLVVLKLFTGTLNQDLESEATLKDLEVKVAYNSIHVPNKKVFGDRIPYGIIWRTGSDDATEIYFSKDCYFANKRIKAGTYSLWTIPRENNRWSIILNKDVAIYGTNYDASHDYLHVEVDSEKIEKFQNDLRIYFTKSEDLIQLLIRLEHQEVKVPISTK